MSLLASVSRSTGDKRHFPRIPGLNLTQIVFAPEEDR